MTMKKFFLLAVVSVLTLASCKKDNDGMWPCANYSSATVNGVEYVWRESYTVPLKGGWPYAQYEEIERLDGKKVDMSFLKMETKLQPVDKGAGDEYIVTLYVKDFSITESPVGKSYVFLPVSVSPGRVLKAMSEGNVSIALVSNLKDGLGSDVPASGSVVFRKHETETKSVSNVGSYIDVDFVLKVEGENPVSMEGSLHTWL